MQSSKLILGWKVTKGLDPEYWLSPDAQSGYQDDSDIISVSAQNTSYHTVFIAQSGSGKSFFLGRYIEEILIKSKARVIIFDPNADFKKINQIVSSDHWGKKTKYKPKIRKGFLLHEKTRNVFSRKWNKIPKIIWTKSNNSNDECSSLKIHWPDISSEFISDGLESSLRSEIQHCHNAMRILNDLFILTSGSKKIDVLSELKKIFKETKNKDEEDVYNYFYQKFIIPIDNKGDNLHNIVNLIKGGVHINSSFFFSNGKKFLKYHLDNLCIKAALSRHFVSTDAERFYFGSVFNIKSFGILSDNPVRIDNNARIEVFDLPSIADPKIRLLTVSTILEAEWKRSRQNWETALNNPPEKDMRVPTFIVLDEAHNLAPREPRNQAENQVREQLRTIAAEGRKFGLFLILVSQRPDKIDNLITSECENKAILKLGSESVLSVTKELLGLQSVPEATLNKCLEFDIGRALLVGPWSNNKPTLTYGAARRSVEGGRNLRKKYWAAP